MYYTIQEWACFEGLREDCRDSCEEGSLNGDTLVWTFKPPQLARAWLLSHYDPSGFWEDPLQLLPSVLPFWNPGAPG